MSEIKVNSIKGVGASAAAITVNNTDGTCTANITDRPNYNKIINGQFDIWQRGTTSGSTTSSGYNSADRWFINQSGATSTTSQQVFDAGQTDVPSNPKYYLRFNPTTANNNAGIEQRIENVEGIQGEHTLSFWAKGTSPYGGSLEIGFQQNFGSGGSTSTQTEYATFSLSGSWVKKTFTFTPTSLSGKTIGTSSFCNLTIRQPASDTSTTAWTLDIANVKLEAGSKATDYQKINVGQELQLCKRYYQQINQESSGTSIITGFGNGSGRLRAIVPLMVEMRANPTVALDVSGGNPTFYSYTGGSPSYSSIAGVESTKKTFTIDINTSSVTAGAPYDWRGSGAFITIAAEL